MRRAEIDANKARIEHDVEFAEPAIVNAQPTS
jgi:hypothetical protein